MATKKRKSTLMTQPWRLVSITTGVQICEGNRVIVYIGEPSTADHGPHRSEDVMERANLLMSIPALAAENARLREVCQMLIAYRDAAGPLNFQLEKADDFINLLRSIIAKADG